MSVSYGGDSITFADGSVNSSGFIGNRNRIINGAMMVDQRNAGSSGTANNNYTLDRWEYFGSQASKGTWQQNGGAVTPPVGFKNYLGFTSSSAYTVGAAESFAFSQHIEGLNVADLAWGTADAKTVTLSFWVRSSLTGTFGGSINPTGNTRGYPYTYTINSANTWEYKTVTIPGDTTGTWGTDNGRGIALRFSLGAGATYSATGNAWTETDNIFNATGATSVVGTNGATWYVTGVQLERGSTASSFEYRSYGTELALCQRYFEMSYDIGTAPAAATTTGMRSIAFAISGSSNGQGGVTFQVSKRTTPTIVIYDGAGTVDKVSTTPGSGTTFTNNRALFAAPFNVSITGFVHQGQSSVGNIYNYAHFTASSEL